MKQRKQFTFYASFFDAILELPDGSREAVYDAVCAFALTGERRELPQVSQRVALKLIMPNLVSSRAKALAAQGKSGDPHNIGRNKKEKENKKENENKKETETEIEKEAEGQSQGLQEAPEPVLLQREFDAFWREYPIKLGKDAAWSLWRERKPDLTDVLEGLALWKNSSLWAEAGGRYIPQAKKFLADGYARQKPPEPKQETACGASGQLGEEEREAIRRLMAAQE